MMSKKRTSRRGPATAAPEAASGEGDERCLRAFFEDLPFGASQIDERRRFIRVNDRFCEITGYSREELLGGMGPLDVIHPEERAANLRRMDRVFKGIGYEAEKRYVRKDGRVVWARVSVSPVLDADGRFLCSAAVIEDITARRAAAEELRRSRVLLNDAERISNIGAAVVDLASGVWMVSEDWAAIHGCTNLIFNQEELMRLAHPDDLPAIEREFQDLFAGTKRYDLTHRIIRQDTGEERIVHAIGELERDEKGLPVKACGVVQDITERRRAGLELEGSRERLRLAVESAGLGMWGCDLTGEHLETTPELRRICGFPEAPAKLARDDFFGIIHPGDLDLLQRAFEAAVEEDAPFAIECRIRRADDGAERWIAAGGKMSVQADGRKHFLGMVRDITGRKSEENELRQSHRLMAKAEQLADIGAWEWDFASDVWTLSDQWQSILGISKARLPTQELLPIAPPEDHEAIQRGFEELRRGTGIYEVEHRIIRQNTGEVRTIQVRGETGRDEQGRPVKAWGVAWDITGQRRAEEALRQSEAFLRNVLHSSLAGIYVYDLQRGTHRFVNEQYTALTGYPPEKLASMEGREFFALFHPQDAAAVAEHIEQLQRAPEGAVLEVEYRFRTADGRWIWALSRDAVFSRNPDGSARELIGCGIDVTERKELEMELLRVRQAERQRVALELHDGVCQQLIATSFAAKAMQRRLAKEGNPLAPQAETLAESISQAAGHARLLARGMDPVVPEGDGLMDALRELAVATAERYGLHCRFECPSPVSISDPVVNTQLYRIAQEALHNAVQHAGARRIEVSLSETESGICLAVRDDGRGLPPDARRSPGLGLRAMRHRAGLIQGELVIGNPKRGTEIVCRVLKPEGPGNADG